MSIIITEKPRTYVSILEEVYTGKFFRFSTGTAVFLKTDQGYADLSTGRSDFVREDNRYEPVEVATEARLEVTYG